MALSQSDAIEAVRERLPYYIAERKRLDVIDAYLHGQHASVYQPANATDEYRLLEKRAIANWLPLIIDAPAQALYVEGYRRSEDEGNAPEWGYWQANGLDARQSGIYRAAMGYGTAYATVLPGAPVPVIRGVSARKMLAFYEDPAADDWPALALRVDASGDGFLFRLYDEDLVYYVGCEGTLDYPREWRYIEHREHDSGVCPVVRFTDGLDLDGRARGQIEPLIPVQDSINQTKFDLLLTQTYGAFKVRTISGVELPAIDEDATVEEQATQRAALEAAKAKIAQDRFLTSDDPSTKFDTLDETPLDGYIAALDAHVRHLAAISQTPPSYLLGQMANLSAEALASAEAGLTRKVEERKHTFGESWEQALRLAANAAGTDATDVSAQVVWRDSEARSLAQTVDALGKAAQMLGVPPEALWERIPGVTQTDVRRWKSLKAESDPLAAFANALNAQTTPPA